MSYFDCVAAAVPTANKAAYETFCRDMGAVFREYGALSVVDVWGTDVPHGQLTDYHRAVAATEGETVAVGWIEWPSKAVRDDAWGRVMQDPRMAAATMPYDGKRMIMGGFERIG